jgi:transketolase
MSAVSHADMANAIRFLSADAVQKANSGHPGMPMGMADVATVLYTKFLKFDAAEPHWPDRDRFVLSAGHGSMLLYSLSYLVGHASSGPVLRGIRNTAMSWLPRPRPVRWARDWPMPSVWPWASA